MLKTLDPSDIKKQVEDLYYFDSKSNKKLQTITNILNEESPRIKPKVLQLANRNIIGSSGEFRKSLQKVKQLELAKSTLFDTTKSKEKCPYSS